VGEVQEQFVSQGLMRKIDFLFIRKTSLLKSVQF